MAYEFSLDKKATVVLISGLGIVVLLLLFVGFLAGLSVNLKNSPQTRLAAAPEPPAPVKGAEEAVQPANQSPAPSAVSAAAAASGTAAGTTPLNPSPASASPPQAPAAGAPALVGTLAGAPAAENSIATGASQAAVAPAARPQSPAPATATANPPLEPAGSAPAPANASASAVAAASPDSCVVAPPVGSQSSEPSQGFERRTYALQMGAFLDPNNANRLATDLKGRGCDATVSKIVDSRGRLWSVVRIGPFPDLAAASRAAAEFKRKSGLLALVRPSESL